jgi:hypothetical protein
MDNVVFDERILDRMVRAVEKVRERLARATAALEKAHVPYAVIGGHAVAAWVAQVDEAAVRNTRDVDILLGRADLPAAAALAQVGFVHRHVKSIDMFLDGPGAKTRDAVYVIFAGEKVRPGDITAAPDTSESETKGTVRVVALEALVRMKLTSFRDKDRTQLRDFLEVGLIDATWVNRYPAEIGVRLQMLIDTPEG